MENKQYLNIEFYGDMKWLEADYINQLKNYSLAIINSISLPNISSGA